MRLIILSVFIIANVSNNGKASLDSFLPSNDNVLLSDTTKSSDKSCNRPCKFNVKPRRCHYDFEIRPMFGEDDLPVLAINGQTPGPPIHVCLHDVIVVRVKNKIANQDIAMHWHGIEQKGTPYMDGVPMVTQCPISYGSVYEYAFAASSPGTFFYHADSGLNLPFFYATTGNRGYCEVDCVTHRIVINLIPIVVVLIQLLFLL